MRQDITEKLGRGRISFDVAAKVGQYVIKVSEAGQDFRLPSLS